MENIKKYLFEIIIAFEFLLLIALSYIFFNHTEGKESKAENRYLASFPALKNADGSFSDTFAEDLTSWFEDNLGLRDAYLTLSGMINYNLLHRPKTSRVEIGDNGFLYLADEGNLALEASRTPEFANDMPEYAMKLQSVSDSLSEQGIDYVIMTAPGKPSIYPENIASSSHSIEDTVGDVFFDHMTENTDIKMVWPKDKLIEAKADKAGNPIYLKTDTHWTVYGRDIAYRDLIENLNKWGYKDIKPVEVSYYSPENEFIGDLSEMMGPVKLNGGRLSEEDYTDWKPVNENAVEILEGETYEAFQKLLYEKNIYNPELCSIYHNEEAPELNVLIFGDSMIRVCMMPELAETFSDLTFVWSYVPDQDIIDLIKPDLVISEYGERELDLRLVDADKGMKRSEEP
ncbi:MAG: hypothetical protein K6G03_07435 [Lachnospiraceae bacterium]|nr:hypothetical protein [Lachnospiraceae bacterium]